MDKYIKNLLPRLKQYGQKLNKIESFVDKTWVLYEPGMRFQTFRFLRSGKLLITISGNVEEHHWEYLPPDSLYIKRLGSTGKMYRQAFFLDTLFIMQVEGTYFEPVLFYNEAEIPNGDVPGYLINMYVEKYNLGEINSNKKFYYEKNSNFSRIEIGAKIFNDNLNTVNYDVIKIENKEIIVHNGIVTKINFIYFINSEKGRLKLITGQQSVDGVVIGAEVYLENNEVFNGKIKILNHDYLNYLIVDNGVLKSISEKVNYAQIVVIILIIIFIITMAYLLQNS